LRNLRRVLDVDPVAGTVPEEILHRVCPITDDDKKVSNAGIAQTFHDMLENWFAPHFYHRLG